MRYTREWVISTISVSMRLVSVQRKTRLSPAYFPPSIERFSYVVVGEGVNSHLVNESIEFYSRTSSLPVRVTRLSNIIRADKGGESRFTKPAYCCAHPSPNSCNVLFTGFSYDGVFTIFIVVLHNV